MAKCCKPKFLTSQLMQFEGVGYEKLSVYKNTILCMFYNSHV